MIEQEHDPLEKTQELFDLLQGVIPEGYSIPRKEVPKLTADQAWTVIWYLGNQYWKVTDHICRCDVCGSLYDSWSSGLCLDYGGTPYFFCDNCVDGEQFVKKMRKNPDENVRKAYSAK